MALLLVVQASPLVAQDRGLTAGAVGFFASLGSANEADYQRGALVGVEGRYRSGRFSVEVRGLWGTLAGDPSLEDRDIRETDVTFAWQGRPWLELHVAAEAFQVSTSLAHSMWRMYGAGARIRAPVIEERLHGWIQAALFPVTSVTASQPLNLPWRAEIGLAVRTPRLPLELGYSYVLHAIDFTTAMDQRLGGPQLTIRYAP